MTTSAHQSGIKSILANTAHLVTARMMSQLMRVAYIVIIARSLGPELYGLLVYGQAVYMVLLPVAALGIGRVLGSEITKFRSRAQALVEQAFTLRVIGAVGAAGLCLLWAWVAEPRPSVQLLFVVFSVALIGRAIASWAEEVCVAFEAAVHVPRQELIFRPMELVASITVVLLGGEVLGLVVVHATIWCLQAMRGLYIVNRHVVRVRTLLWGPEAGYLLTRGIPLGLASFLMIWLFQGPVILFQQMVDDPRMVGQFALAMQALAILTTLIWSFVSASLPVLSRSVTRRDGKNRLYIDVFGRLGWLGAPVLGLIGIVLGPVLIRFFLGSEYKLTGELVGWILMLCGPMLVGLVSETVLIAQGRRKSTVAFAFMGAMVLTVSMSLLGREYGAAGAVAAAALGMGVWAIGQSVQLRMLGLGATGRSFIVPLSVAVVALVTYTLMRDSVGEGALLALTLMILLAGAIGCLSTDERRLARVRVSALLNTTPRDGG